MLAFDFFFVPPRFSFTVEEAQYIVTFVVMCLVGLVISHLAAGMRQQATLARLQERQAAAMHGLSRQLASTRGIENILQAADRYIAEIFDAEVVAMLPNEEGKLNVAAGDVSSVIQKDVVNQMHVARSALESGRMAGWGTSNSPARRRATFPCRRSHATPGILALRPRDPGALSAARAGSAPGVPREADRPRVGSGAAAHASAIASGTDRVGTHRPPARVAGRLRRWLACRAGGGPLPTPHRADRSGRIARQPDHDGRPMLGRAFEINCPAVGGDDLSA